MPNAPRHPGAPVVPRLLADSTMTVVRQIRTIARASDVRSRARLARLTVQSALGLQRAQPEPGSVVEVHVPGPERTIWLRNRSHDCAAFEFLHEESQHLPPAELTGPLRHIAVFGANIGLLLADLGDRYPGARLLGVEPDPDNAAVARRNLERFGDHAVVVEAAAAHEDGILMMRWGHGAWGFQSHDDSLALAETRPVPARDTGAMLREFTGGAPLDYLLVNIESAWFDLLKRGEWSYDVRCVKIEIQDHYDEAVPLLESLGFRTHLETLRWGAFLVGVRP